MNIRKVFCEKEYPILSYRPISIFEEFELEFTPKGNSSNMMLYFQEDGYIGLTIKEIILKESFFPYDNCIAPLSLLDEEGFSDTHIFDMDITVVDLKGNELTFYYTDVVLEKMKEREMYFSKRGKQVKRRSKSVYSKMIDRDYYLVMEDEDCNTVKAKIGVLYDIKEKGRRRDKLVSFIDFI